MDWVSGEELGEMFEFLDELRESGATNMFGARPYLMREYAHLTGDEAATVLRMWMDTFSLDTAPETRASKALGETK